MTRKPKTAAELLAELRQNPEFVAREQLREAQNRQREEASRLEQAELLKELTDTGVRVKSVWDLVNTREKYLEAIPTLVRHLSLPYSAGVKEGIVRALTVDYAGSKALRELIRELGKQDDDSETSMKWVLGNAIATVAKSNDADTLVGLATDPSHGKARDMIISALPLVVQDKIELKAVLRRLMRDEDVGEFARRAILKLNKKS